MQAAYKLLLINPLLFYLIQVHLTLLLTQSLDEVLYYIDELKNTWYTSTFLIKIFFKFETTKSTVGYLVEYSV